MFLGLRLENYRAFKSAAFFPKPLTIVLGPNNSGKSSLVQALRILSQTAAASESNQADDSSPLVLNSGEVSILDHTDLFHKRGTLPLLICPVFKLKAEKIQSRNWTSSVGQSVAPLYRIGLASERKDLQKRARLVSRDLYPPLLSGELSDQALLDTLDQIFDEFSLLDAIDRQRVLEVLISSYPSPERSRIVVQQNKDEQNKRRIEEIRSELRFAIRFSSFVRKKIADGAEMSVGYTFRHDSAKAIKLCQLSISLDSIVIFEAKERPSRFVINTADRPPATNVAGSQTLDVRLFDPVSEETKQIDPSEASRIVSLDRNIFSVIQPSRTSVWSTVVAALLEYARSQILEADASHVGPYRSRAKSVYVLPEVAAGDDYVVDVVRRVSRQQKEQTRLNSAAGSFGFHVKFDKLMDSVYSLQVAHGSSSSAHYHLNSVGFGLLHLIPILDEMLEVSKYRIACIEQPEAHLHPKMHTVLADMFIEVVRLSPKSRIIVETHSDHLLSRISRRVRDGECLQRDQLSVIYVDQDEDGVSSISDLYSASDAEIEWPESFIETKVADQIGKLRSTNEIFGFARP